MGSNFTYDFPVAIEPAFTHKGKLIPRRFAVVRTDTGEPLSIVSDRYALITHNEVMEAANSLLDQLGPQGNRADKVYLERDGTSFTYVVTYREHGRDLKVGDKVGLRVYVKNSYSGKQCASIKIGGLVLSCLNGMVRQGRTIQNLSITHSQKGRTALSLPSAQEVLQEFNTATGIWDTWGTKAITPLEYNRAITDLTGPIINEGAVEVLLNRKHETVWDLSQNITYHLTHERGRMSETSRVDLLGRANSYLETTFGI